MLKAKLHNNYAGCIVLPASLICIILLIAIKGNVWSNEILKWTNLHFNLTAQNNNIKELFNVSCLLLLSWNYYYDDDYYLLL